MSKILSKAWLYDATERALKTAAQTAVTLIGQDKLFDVLELSWGAIGGTALGAALLSVLSSVISAPANGVSPASIAPPA